MNLISKRCFLALICFFGSSVSNAVPITWGIEGVTAGAGLPGGPCEILGCRDIRDGVPFTAFVTFDSHAIDLNSDPYSGNYISSGGPYGVSLTIGNYSFESDIVQIVASAWPNDSPGLWPQYHIRSEQEGSRFKLLGLVSCYEPGTSIITSDDLRTTPLPYAGGCPDPAFIRTASDYDIALNVTRYFQVSEPAGFAVFGIGIGALTLVRRRRNRGHSALTG